MKKAISIILKSISDLPTLNERKEALAKQRENIALLLILKYAFNPNVKWQLPEGVPPYKPLKHEFQDSMLYGIVKKFTMFFEGTNNLTKFKREMKFIEYLESIHPDDANMLCFVKDKKMPFKNINFKLVDEVFPGLLSEPL